MRVRLTNSDRGGQCNFSNVKKNLYLRQISGEVSVIFPNNYSDIEKNFKKSQLDLIHALLTLSERPSKWFPLIVHMGEE